MSALFCDDSVFKITLNIPQFSIVQVNKKVLIFLMQKILLFCIQSEFIFIIVRVPKAYF